VLDETDSTMDKMITADLESQETNDGGANGSSIIDTTIMHPMVQDLAFSASNKAQKRVLKQAATEQPMTTQQDLDAHADRCTQSLRGSVLIWLL
jgi:hypothetical protein